MYFPCAFYTFYYFLSRWWTGFRAADPPGVLAHVPFESGLLPITHSLLFLSLESVPSLRMLFPVLWRSFGMITGNSYLFNQRRFLVPILFGIWPFSPASQSLSLLSARLTFLLWQVSHSTNYQMFLFSLFSSSCFYIFALKYTFFCYWSHKWI